VRRSSRDAEQDARSGALQARKIWLISLWQLAPDTHSMRDCVTACLQLVAATSNVGLAWCGAAACAEESGSAAAKTASAKGRRFRVPKLFLLRMALYRFRRPLASAGYFLWHGPTRRNLPRAHRQYVQCPEKRLRFRDTPCAKIRTETQRAKASERFRLFPSEAAKRRESLANRISP
jgi:hypothetical protein